MGVTATRAKERLMSASYLIVVGVDGSEGGRRALDWAAAEAATRGGAVQAVIAWSWDGMEYGPIAATQPDQERFRAHRELDQEIQAVIAVAPSSMTWSTPDRGRRCGG